MKSELLEKIKLSETFLDDIKERLKKHKHRAAFANCLIETLLAYNTKPLTKKCTLARQLGMVRTLKKLFYLRNSEIVSFMDRAQLFMGGMHTLDSKN